MTLDPRSVFALLLAPVKRVVDATGAGLEPLQRTELDRVLAELVADTDAMLAADDHDEFCEALRRLGGDLVELAGRLLVPLVPIGEVTADLVMPLAVKVLRSQYPRLSAVLTVAGVIVDHPSDGADIDWEALRDFLLNPPKLIDEAFWDQLFTDQDIEGTGHMPALLLALLLMAPATVGALRRGETSIASLDPPPVSTVASTDWRQLRANSIGWVPITFPLRRDPADGRLTFAAFTDLRGDVTPEVALSLLIRSRRRLAAGRKVTDFEMWVHPSIDADAHELRTNSARMARLSPGVRVGLGYDGGAGTWNAAVRRRAGEPFNEASLVISKDTGDGSPDLLIGPPYDTRIVAQNIAAEVHLRESGEPNVEVVGRIDGFGVVLTNRWFRSLGEPNNTLREGLRFDLDLVARLVDGEGFSLAADGALETRLHIDKTIGLKILSLRIHSIGVRVPVRATEDDFNVRGEVTAHWSATVGPVTLVMDGAGGWVGWWADEPGGAKHCIGLLPPTGAGLQLNLRGVTAGGFLDFTGGANDRYGGVITVAIGPPKGTSGFSVTAFGLHELTGAPGSANRSRSVIVVLGMTFRPGIQLGWGLSLTGVGGLVGINRRADTDALRERLTAGAVGNVLFADDPIRNAPVLLGDLAAIFPAADGVYVVGITCQISWIAALGDSFVKFAIGIIIELPGPTKVVILGSVRIKVPHAESVLDLQIDLVGVADFVRKTFELDATIRHGKLIGVFTVTGDAAIRASWGERPYLMATLGGFHPDFHPEPAVFPDLARFRIAVDKALLPKAVSLSGSGYLAVTTNTLQAGIEFSATISSGNWNIQGFVGGDALIRLPFFFDISLRGGVRVRWKSHTLVGITFKGGLRGPNPASLYGEVCIELLFFDICFSDSWELSNGNVQDSAVIASLVPVLAVELASVANLAMADGADRHVNVAVRQIGARSVLSPLGTLTWEQHRVPLGLAVETFEGSRLDEPQRVTVEATVASQPIDDWFSTGLFLDLDVAEALALPAFERHQSGITVSLAETSSAALAVTVDVEQIRLPLPPRPGGLVTFPMGVIDRLDGRSADTSVPPIAPPRFGVRDEAFDVTVAGGVVRGSRVAVHAAATLAGDSDRYRQPVQHTTDRLMEVPV